MSFKAVWGFDPEEVVRAGRAFANCDLQFADYEQENDGDLKRIVRIPLGPDAQVYELRRIFRL